MVVGECGTICGTVKGCYAYLGAMAIFTRPSAGGRFRSPRAAISARTPARGASRRRPFRSARAAISARTGPRQLIVPGGYFSTFDEEKLVPTAAFHVWKSEFSSE